MGYEKTMDVMYMDLINVSGVGFSGENSLLRVLRHIRNVLGAIIPSMMESIILWKMKVVTYLTSFR